MVVLLVVLKDDNNLNPDKPVIYCNQTRGRERERQRVDELSL